MVQQPQYVHEVFVPVRSRIEGWGKKGLTQNPSPTKNCWNIHFFQVQGKRFSAARVLDMRRRYSWYVQCTCSKTWKRIWSSIFEKSQIIHIDIYHGNLNKKLIAQGTTLAKETVDPHMSARLKKAGLRFLDEHNFANIFNIIKHSLQPIFLQIGAVAWGIDCGKEVKLCHILSYINTDSLSLSFFWIPTWKP